MVGRTKQLKACDDIVHPGALQQTSSAEEEKERVIEIESKNCEISETIPEAKESKEYNLERKN